MFLYIHIYTHFSSIVSVLISFTKLAHADIIYHYTDGKLTSGYACTMYTHAYASIAYTYLCATKFSGLLNLLPHLCPLHIQVMETEATAQGSVKLNAYTRIDHI